MGRASWDKWREPPKQLAVCSHCGQRMLLRFGVALSPRKAELVDFIADCTKGRGGVPLAQIIVAFYSGVPNKKAADAIRNHICQINGLLCATNWRIVNRAGLYRLE